MFDKVYRTIGSEFIMRFRDPKMLKTVGIINYFSSAKYLMVRTIWLV